MSACTFEPRAGEPRTTRRVDIEFLYIDLTTCSRCLGTDENLEAALGMVAQVLEATGVEVQVRKILVESEQQAEALHFVSSPTIRVNGRDIALQTKESSCGSCSELAGQDTGCRVWAYQGRDHTTAPVGMIVEALLKGIYGREEQLAATATFSEVPDNLKRFFAARAQERPEAQGPCCTPTTGSPCCDR